MIIEKIEACDKKNRKTHMIFQKLSFSDSLISRFANYYLFKCFKLIGTPLERHALKNGARFSRNYRF